MQRRHVYGAGIALAGVFLAGVQTVQGLQQSTRGIVFAFEAVPFVLVALTLTYAGYWLARQPHLDPDAARILSWGVGGAVLFASLAALLLFGQRVFLGTLDRAAVVAMDHLTVGSVVGVVVGLYDARGRKRRRDLEAERDRVEAFGNKAADVNNYGRALNECSDVDEVSALCIQGIQALLGVSEVAVLAIDGDDTSVVDDTTLNVERASLELLGRRARGGERATVVTSDDLPEAVTTRANAVVSLELTGTDERSFVLVALAPETTVAEEDVQLLELLASHAGTAIDGVLAHERTDDRHAAAE